MSIKQEQATRILELMPKGKDNKKPMQYFRDNTGMSRRTITDTIRYLRKDYAICATREAPGGYWIGDIDDIDSTIHMLMQSKYTVDNTIRQMLRHRYKL